MASVKVKFRPSTIEGKTGALYFQVIHRRIVRSQKTKYKIYPDEWNARTARITLSPSSQEFLIFYLPDDRLRNSSFYGFLYSGVYVAKGKTLCGQFFLNGPVINGS